MDYPNGTPSRLTSNEFVEAQPTWSPDGRWIAFVSWDESGRLLFHGRSDDQLKIRGYRIEPGEIEAALTAIPGVDRVVVVARALTATPGAPRDQLVAFVEADTDSLPGDWRTHLGETLPPHMVPAHLERVGTLPRLPNGKVDREALAKVALTPGPSGEGRDESASSLEALLRILWSDLLGRSDIGLDDNFFTLGGQAGQDLILLHCVSA